MCGNPFVMGKIGSSTIPEPSILATSTEFFEREALSSCEGTYGRCGHIKTGIMNYSPKGSGRGSSMNINRNMKNLSLDLGKNGSLHKQDEEKGSGRTVLESGIPTKKSLTLSISANDVRSSEHVAPLKTPAVTRTPTFPPLMPSQRASRNSPRRETHLFTSDQIHPYSRKPATKEHRHVYNTSNNDLRSPFLTSGDEKLISSFKNLTVPERSVVPEELQEFSSLDAYPHGPANVLNDLIYLYSDPSNGNSKVDVNDFDLVINVAKECEDKSDSFDTKNGTREYLYIPWVHNSSISHDLPELTRKIQQYDDSDNESSTRRKILVHCQCGVSRSACVIVAYFMLKFNLGVNQAYELLKSGTSNQKESTNKLISSKGYSISACARICPNMNLIFELMAFNDRLKANN